MRRAFCIEMNMLDADVDAREAATELDRLTSSFGDLATTPSFPLSIVSRRAYTSFAPAPSATSRFCVRRTPSSTRPNEPKKSLVSNQTIEIEPKPVPESPDIPLSTT
jgi:hypothetical protein